MTANAATRLLQHYVDNFRRLPWRSPPDSPPPDPYRVWLSEVMLQQTTVAAVIPRFKRFVARWPTIEALAAARDEEILSEWAGLGYYARARNLIACAREVAATGGFPTTAAELRKLPGIGDYTSAAIAAIAFGEAAAAVDTNVERVIARYRGVDNRAEGGVDQFRKKIREVVRSSMPIDRPGDFTQAIMDLGAVICRPKAPLCGQCPLQPDCVAYASGTPEAFPAPKARRARPVRHGAAWWIERGGHVWLIRRPAKGMLGGMAALPGSDWTEAPHSPDPLSLGTISHVFTHFALELEVVERFEPVGEGWWQPLERLSDPGLPTLYRRAVDVAMNALERARAAA